MRISKKIKFSLMKKAIEVSEIQQNLSVVQLISRPGKHTEELGNTTIQETK